MWGLNLYFIRAFQPDELYQFLDITISLQISSQEAITLANIVFQSMSGSLDGIARINGTHSFIGSFVRSFIHSFIHRSFVRSKFVLSIIRSSLSRERERERERERGANRYRKRSDETVLRLF